MFKKTLGTFIPVMLVLFTASAAWAEDSYQARQSRQRAAIYQGMIDGSISEEEFVDLDSEQYDIETGRREAMSDGYIDYDERNRLEWELELAGRNIRLALASGPVRGYAGWGWDPYYDRYGYWDFWFQFYSRGPYWHRHYPERHYRPQRRPPRYRPEYRNPPRNRPEYRHPPRNRPERPRPYPPRIVPYGRFEVGYNGPGFGFGWSINVR